MRGEAADGSLGADFEKKKVITDVPCGEVAEKTEMEKGIGGEKKGIYNENNVDIVPSV